MDSEYYAKEVIEKIIAASGKLNDFLMLRRIVPELNNDNIRELFIYSYRLMYEVSDDNVNIIALVHGKRNFPKE